MRRIAGFVIALALLALSCAKSPPGLALRQGNWEAGEKELPATSEPKIDQWAYYAYSLSVLAELKGDLEAAIRFQKEALSYDPRSLYLLTTLATLHLKAGQLREALKAGERVLALNPDYLPAHLLMASVYRNLKNFKAAEHHYREVIRIDPTRSEAYFALGGLYIEARRFPEAIGIYQK
ncbi:MAG: tetratricopeptide repeat protein, partial [Candidatus Methylomirabilales bacterium]